MRDVDAGLTTLQVDPGTARTSLAACQTVETTEFGAFYVDASGSFVFKNRTTTSTSVSGTPKVFNDNGTNLHYFNADWVLNDVLVYNQASVTPTGGTAQVVVDAASVTKYFAHSYNQTATMFSSDADALQYARAYIASRAETSIRCDALILDLYYPDAAMVLAALELDFFDPVTITTTQPAAVGTSTLTKTLQVFGVQHSISVNSWKTTFTTLEPIIDGFIVGSSLYGIFDTSVLSY